MRNGGSQHEELQADLFTAAPTSRPHFLARRTDPASSHAAAAEVTRSGRLAAQKAQVLAAVRQWPGRTSLELASRMAADRYVIARRLPDLEKDGLVRKGGIRQCSAGSRPAVEWWPINIRET